MMKISQTQLDLSCGSGTADTDKENVPSSQTPASLEIRGSGSTTPDGRSLDYPGGSAIEERSQLEEAAESLLHLSRNDSPAAANHSMDAGHSKSRHYDGPAPLAKPDKGGSGFEFTCINGVEG